MIIEQLVNLHESHLMTYEAYLSVWSCIKVVYNTPWGWDFPLWQISVKFPVMWPFLFGIYKRLDKTNIKK